MAILSEIQSSVRFGLGSRSDLLAGDGLSALNGWINAAQREICHRFRFSELEREDTSLVTNASDRFVSIPGNVYAVLSVYDATNSRLLDPFPGGYPEYERAVSSTIRTRPTEWLRFANRIYFKDPPDNAYSLRCGFWVEPDILGADLSASPIIPEVWHDGIKILAKRNGWRDLGDDRRAQAIVSEEWQPFLSWVRSPMGIEMNNAKRRGLKFRRNWHHQHMGV